MTLCNNFNALVTNGDATIVRILNKVVGLNKYTYFTTYMGT